MQASNNARSSLSKYGTQRPLVYSKDRVEDAVYQTTTWISARYRGILIAYTQLDSLFSFNPLHSGNP